MKRTLKSLALLACRKAGLFRAARKKNARKPLVLMFHGFTLEADGALGNSQHKHLHGSKFDAFLAHLARYYYPTGLPGFIQSLRDGSPLPDHAAVLTFDDGFLSNYAIAFPLLKKWNCPASIFLATEFVEEKKPIWVDRVDYALGMAGRSLKELVETKRRLKAMNAASVGGAVEEIEGRLGFKLMNSNDPEAAPTFHAMDWHHAREMHSSGLVSFGAHTHRHWILGRCQPDEADYELRVSKSLIEERLGVPCEDFCYPNGAPGDFTETTEELVKMRGFRSSLTTVAGRNAPQGSPYLMRRLGVTNDLDPLRFEAMLCGLRH